MCGVCNTLITSSSCPINSQSSAKQSSKSKRKQKQNPEQPRPDLVSLRQQPTCDTNKFDLSQGKNRGLKRSFPKKMNACHILYKKLFFFNVSYILNDIATRLICPTNKSFLQTSRLLPTKIEIDIASMVARDRLTKR